MNPAELPLLFWTFLKVGLFSFGGGYPVLPLIATEVVQRHHWLTAPQFANLLAIAQLVPGPVLVNTASLVGYRVGGFPGALVGALGVVLPTFIIMFVITYYYQLLYRHSLFRRLIRGFYPTLVALLAGATVFFAQSSPLSWKVVVIAGLTCGALATRRLNPFWILIGAAVLGGLL
ncbi:MAG TPA: chromate transporter [Syntrophomonadaceae bacterium]|nr:chromate transporter [Syntrophomonadaceae bacterium]